MKKFIVLLAIFITTVMVGCGEKNNDVTTEGENNRAIIESEAVDKESVVDDETNLIENETFDKDSLEFFVDSRVGSLEFGFVDLPMSWADLHPGHGHGYVEYGDSEEKYIFSMDERVPLGDNNLQELMETVVLNMEDDSIEDVNLESVELNGVEGYKVSATGNGENKFKYFLWATAYDGYIYSMTLTSYDLEVNDLVEIIEGSFRFDN